MHNRKKQVKPLTDNEIATLNKKCMMYESLLNILFERRDHHKKEQEEYTVETLALTKKMLSNNPDFYTLWNFRREILYELYPSLRSLSTSTSIEVIHDRNKIRDEELELSTEGIKRNPKSCE